MQKPSNIGGQAVLEGIMMRHGQDYAVAVRKPDNGIIVKKDHYRSIFPHAGVEQIPIVRGIVAFFDSLITGVGCLTYSAQFFEEEPEGEKPVLTKEEEAKAAKKAERQEKWFAVLTVALSVLLTVGLFMLLPYFLAGILRRFGAPEVVVSLLEALLRILIFLIYMLLISKMKDIQRVFMYHGAEHKCINCLENGLPLNVENVLASSREHKRCGTSFLLVVVMLTVICFLVLGLFGITSPILRLVLRLLLIPVIAGLAYEFIRLAGRSENPVVLALSRPGMLLQHLVTREPDAMQAEVAIAAVEAVFDWRTYLKENFPDEEDPEEIADSTPDAYKDPEGEDGNSAEGKDEEIPAASEARTDSEELKDSEERTDSEVRTEPEERAEPDERTEPDGMPDDPETEYVGTTYVNFRDQSRK